MSGPNPEYDEKIRQLEEADRWAIDMFDTLIKRVDMLQRKVLNQEVAR